MNVLIVQMNPTVGDIQGNGKKICDCLKEAQEKKGDIVLFPELALCGYPPDDLVFYPNFIAAMKKELEKIATHSKGLMVIVGLVRESETKKGKGLFNSAAILIDGELVGYKDKTLLPTYDVFNESRYFTEGEEQKVFSYKGEKVGVLICEDMWQHAGLLEETHYSRDPVEELKKLQPTLVINISASPYYFQKRGRRLDVFVPAIQTLSVPFIWCNQVGANDSLVFDGLSMYLNGKGELLQLAKGFEEEKMWVDLDEKKVPCSFEEDPLESLYQALVLGVRDYFTKQGFTKACLGLSGGVDSALVACIAVKALGKENVLAINMPSRFSSKASFTDSVKLAENLQISMKQISIDGIYQNMCDLLKPLFLDQPFDTTEENIQARVRGMILMAVSNKLGYIVLSTGNKSETAIGYTTLYGDMCGGLGVISDMTKTKVYALCQWINRKKEIIPKNILTKAPSAELRENQKDGDTLPSYETLDEILKRYVEEHTPLEEVVEKGKFPKELVEDLVKKVHVAEYKRRQGPPGIRVSKKAFSKGRQFPIVQKWI